jgi:hypothetical protein
VLLLTYEGQKPPSPEFHTALASWIKEGGALVVIDNDGDPYNAVREWWNQAPNAFQTPRQHLFSILGLDPDATGLHRVGRGIVLSERKSPAGFSRAVDGGDSLRKIVQEAAAAVKLPWKESNALVLRRGPYIVAAGLDESLPNTASYALHGHFIDLFDARQSIVNDVVLEPKTRKLLVDLDAGKSSSLPRIVAAACRVREEHATADTLTFKADGIADTNAVVSIATRRQPKQIQVAGKPLSSDAYSYSNGILRLQFTSSVEALPVEIHFSR